MRIINKHTLTALGLVLSVGGACASPTVPLAEDDADTDAGAGASAIAVESPELCAAKQGLGALKKYLQASYEPPWLAKFQGFEAQEGRDPQTLMARLLEAARLGVPPLEVYLKGMRLKVEAATERARQAQGQVRQLEATAKKQAVKITTLKEELAEAQATVATPLLGGAEKQDKRPNVQFCTII